MATITTIAAGDGISPSRSVINTNFANLNNDKIETSVIDTDTALSANSDAKLPSQKAVKSYIDANLVAPVSVETTSSASHSLTTTAAQRVFVTAKGWVGFNSSTNEITVELKYNGVTKDSVTIGVTTTSSNAKLSFFLQYTEIPGAGTQNVTVTTTGYTAQDVKIVVQKVRI